ncbi:hypothetical protein [Chryseobacterium indologenes]|uniref:hypothetical protein n=1 Tax=Chryseobacterium indologenes TaxID=253 RepID=UPI0009A22AE9|nr:hypothetical protein [Chryseobacterium indologenes]
MIFLSAQPDDTYFIWQLEIQLRNFRSLGILKERIHIVIGYHPKIGLKSDFKVFIHNNHDFALFFLYPDTRKRKKYLSSIRPHLLKKHWKQFPFLENQCIFYHDSDILLSRIPVIDTHNAMNYVSDTSSYLNCQYISLRADTNLLYKMAELVGISVEIVLRNDDHVGGAQYVLHDMSFEFWDKVEEDSENIFNLLTEYNINEKQKKINLPDYLPKEIHAWYADMWAVLWNLWFFNKEVRLHEEMNFSWPTSPIEYWEINPILHYAGDHEDKKQFFYKRDYVNYAPWYDENLHFIPDTNCSFPIVQLIKKRREELDRQRLELKNFTFCFTEDIGNKYFDKYFFTKENQSIIEIFNSIIVPESLVKEIDTLLKDETYTEIQFTKVYIVDQLFTEAFKKVLDVMILELNKEKFSLQDTDTIIKIKESYNTWPLTITKEIYLIQ